MTLGVSMGWEELFRVSGLHAGFRWCAWALSCILLPELCTGHWKHMWTEVDGVCAKPVGISVVVWSQSEVPSSTAARNPLESIKG